MVKFFGTSCLSFRFLVLIATVLAICLSASSAFARGHRLRRIKNGVANTAALVVPGHHCHRGGK